MNEHEIAITDNSKLSRYFHSFKSS